MATLFTICQGVARDAGVTVPSSIVGNTETTAARLLRIAQKSGRRLARKHAWPILQKEHTFSTAASTASYSLPDDFDRLIDSTAWDRTNYWQVRGPLSPQEWQVLKSGLVQSAALRKRFRIKPDSRVNKFFLDPTPDAVESLVFEYVSDEWCADASNTTGQTAWALDTDIPLIDDELLELDILWRFLKASGLDYTEEREEFDGALESRMAQDGGAPILHLDRPSIDLVNPNVPTTGFGS